MSLKASKSNSPVYIGQNIYIKPSYVVSLPEYWREGSGFSHAFRLNMKNLANNSTGGKISKKADKGLRNAINWLLCQADEKQVFHKAKNFWFKFKVNFITLTLPDTEKQISERDFKTKLLQPWLTLMRSYYGMKNYVWKLEFQKNGKIHIHITADTFIHYKTLRRTWNNLLLRNGYMRDFANKFGHSNPNSIDVHSVRKVKNLAGYLAKYMAKDAGTSKQIRGRIWGCNYELSKANKTVVHIPAGETAQGLRCLMHKAIEYKPMMVPNPVTGLLTAWGEIFYLRYSHWKDKITGPIREKFDEVIIGLKNLAHDGTLFADLAQV